MPHKYSHDMNAPSIIINTNGVYIKASIRVNYTRDLACFLFLAYNIVKNNCSFTFLQTFSPSSTTITQ